jgi:hypothetical protein
VIKVERAKGKVSGKLSTVQKPGVSKNLDALKK